MGAPVGNKNAANARLWRAAIEKAVNRRIADGRIQGLEDLADKLIDGVLAGDMSALKEFGDRYDGKPAQTVNGPGERGEHFLNITQTIVDA